jgi:hypothetical protein
MGGREIGEATRRTCEEYSRLIVPPTTAGGRGLLLSNVPLCASVLPVGSRVPLPAPVLYLAIPAHNEVATIGVLLWRIRTVLAEFPREYEVVVYDDASSDETAEVAEQYANAMPVTVLRGAAHVGYAGALDALIRYVSAQTRYPRRDALMLIQGDFTDPPGIVPEFARRFEGGADLVVGERMVVADAPTPVRRLFKAAHWVMRPFVRVHGVNDLTATMRLVRISALRDLVRQAGSDPICVGDSWTANADLLLKLVPLARRVESVPMEPTYGVRMRDTRRVAVRDALAALQWAWGARGRRAVAGSVAGSTSDSGSDADRRPRGGAPAGKRRDDTELSVEKLRERVRDRPRIEDEESFNGRREGRRRERERAKGERSADEPREVPTERVAERVAERAPERIPETPPAESRPPRAKRARAETAEGQAKPKRPERLPRGERPARSDAAKPPRRAREDARSPYRDPSIELEDPFAPPASKREGANRAIERALGPVDEAEPLLETGTTRGRSDEHDAAPLARRTPPPAVDEREDDGEDDGSEAGDSAEAAEGEEGAAPRRKRRRNRRSRRGRAKKDGATADADEGSTEANAESAGAPMADADESDREQAADASAAEGDESELDSAARARRRGRRGRRGGARRSRGRRDKDAGEGGTEGGGEG